MGYGENYEVGITSGWHKIAQDKGLLGVAQKIATAATTGASYIQVDFENTSEFVEPDVLERIRQVTEDLNIRWGAHGEINSLMAWESGIEVIWKQSHIRLHQYLDGIYDYFIKNKGQPNQKDKDYTKYKPEYINFHVSNIHPIGLLAERYKYQGQIQNDFRGFENWEKLLNENKKLKSWFQKTILKYLFAEVAGFAPWDKRHLIKQLIVHAFQEKEIDKEKKSRKIIEKLEKYIKKHREIIEKNNKRLKEISNQLQIENQKPQKIDEEYITDKNISKREISYKELNERIQKLKQEQENLSNINHSKIESFQSLSINEMVNDYFESEFDDNEIVNVINDFMFDKWLDLTQTRKSRGVIEKEDFAYAIIAKYLEYQKDNTKEPLWNLYFKGKSMENLEQDWKISNTGDNERKLWDEKRGIVNLMPNIVAMVAARYIMGHFERPNLTEFIHHRVENFGDEDLKYQKLDSFYKKTALEKINQLKIFITFENPDPLGEQMEGLQRIIHLKDIHKLIKAFKSVHNTKYILGWVDIEHYLHNGLNPLDEFKSLDDDALKDFYGLHVGNPKTYAPGHDTIDVGSEAQRWIYVYAYNMRKKGYGMGENKGIIMFERGGGKLPGEFLGQSVISIRLIVEQLKKDTLPENLPLKFFGVSSDGIYSVEKQLETMHEHYWDPLKGLLAVPEEEHTFLSKSALDKGKRPEEFKKSELT